MDKKHSRILSIITVFCICVASLSFLFVPKHKDSALAAQSDNPKNIFDYVSISTSGYAYSYADVVKSGTLEYLYINSSLTLKNKTNNSISVTYLAQDASTQILDSGASYVINYNSSLGEKQLVVSGFTLQIVHSKINFKNTNPLTFDFNDDTVTVPTHKSIYKSMIIAPTPNSATESSPLFIKMNYNGQLYYFEYDGSEFYIAGSAIAGLSELSLNAPGPYIIEVFDNTIHTPSTSPNYLKYEFTIEPNTNTQKKFEDGLSDFYYTLQSTETGEYYAAGTFVNDQGKEVTTYEFTNDSIKLQLFNTDKVSSLFDGIVVTKSYAIDSGSNYNEKTFYSLSKLSSSDVNFTITLQEHADYTIEVVKNYNTSTRTYTSITCYKSKIFVVRDIQSSGITINEKTYSAENINEIIPETITNNVNNRYILSDGTEIYDGHISSAILRIVNAQSSISGISNNASTSDNVELTINGVGNIKVETTHNGTTTTTYVANGDIVNYSTSGTYYVRITDEMGNIVTRSFKINAKMNAAALALIIIGGIALVIIVLFIFKTRRKIKVR